MARYVGARCSGLGAKIRDRGKGYGLTPKTRDKGLVQGLWIGPSIWAPVKAKDEGFG